MTPFDGLPDYSRIWIYQADRTLTGKEIKEIQQMSDEFTSLWVAHGKGLKAGARTFYNQFLILSVNEKINGASGCSIDSSVDFIRQLENRYRINFLDRSKIAYLSGKDVNLTDRRSIKGKIESGEITGETLIFNNLIETKEELNHKWLIPAKESWMKRYFGG